MSFHRFATFGTLHLRFLGLLRADLNKSFHHGPGQLLGQRLSVFFKGQNVGKLSDVLIGGDLVAHPIQKIIGQ
jgi:hypothetical protein